MKHSVYVLTSTGTWVTHGAPRASEGQARSVARLLARRLGWLTAWGTEAPEPVDPEAATTAGAPTADLASLSPVWKNADLAAKWAAASGK